MCVCVCVAEGRVQHNIGAISRCSGWTGGRRRDGEPGVLSALAFDGRAIRRPADTQLAKQSLGPLLTANDMGATAHAASKHPRGGGGAGACRGRRVLRGGGAEGAEGWVVRRGSELVEYRIRSEHFRLAGSMFVSSLPRVCVCNSGVRVRRGGRVDRANNKRGISGATRLRDVARWNAACPGAYALTPSAGSGATWECKPPWMQTAGEARQGRGLGLCGVQRGCMAGRAGRPSDIGRVSSRGSDFTLLEVIDVINCARGQGRAGVVGRRAGREGGLGGMGGLCWGSWAVSGTTAWVCVAPLTIRGCPQRYARIQ